MNALRRLLVHVDGSPRSAQRLQLACELARELARSCDAGVTAMLAVEQAWVAVPMAGMGDAGGAVLLQTADDARRQRARAQFDEQTTRTGPGVTWCDAGRAPMLEDRLQAHGVQAQMLHQGSNGRGVGDMLLSLEADRGSDLLVMGCYGHARAREWPLSGVTERVLHSMSLPVLLAH